MIPPYPFYELDPDDFEVVSEFDKLWFARIRLLFRVTVQPRGVLAQRQELSLAFITTFEDDIGGAIRESDTTLSDHGCKILYEVNESKPICYIVPISNILGRVPLMPCYLDGNPTPTIPHTFSHLRHGKFRARGIVPDTKLGSGNGTKLFRLNMFAWSMGRCLPRFGGPEYSVEECEERRKKVLSEARKRASVTRKRRAEAAALHKEHQQAHSRVRK